MTKTANRRFIDKDERIHGEMPVEYALIPAAFAVVVYDVHASISDKIGSLDSDVDRGLPTRRADSSIRTCQGSKENSREEEE
jgi:hypothetical protein